jgi:hypothetical protein
MAPHPPSSHTPTRSRFSVILPLNSDTRSSVFRRKPSVTSMSSDMPSPSSPPSSTPRTSSISPTRVFPIFANSWHRSPLHNLNSKDSHSSDPTSQTGSGKVGLTDRARKFGKRFGGTVDQATVIQDENVQNDGDAIHDVPPSRERLSLSRTKSQPSNAGPSTLFVDGSMKPAATQTSSRPSTSSLSASDDDGSQDRTSSRPRSFSKTSLKSATGTDTQSVFSFSPRLDVDYQLKARLDKLHRHLGEEIPPELVLGNTTNSPGAHDSGTRRSSTSQSLVTTSRRPSTAGADHNACESQDSGKKRRSLDSSFQRPLPDNPTSENKGMVLVKAKRSLWMKHARQAEKDKGRNDLGRGLQNQTGKEDVTGLGLERHVSQRQRALNVKRARKMAQVSLHFILF